MMKTTMTTGERSLDAHASLTVIKFRSIAFDNPPLIRCKGLGHVSRFCMIIWDA
jgi:hypothetical protein